MLIYDCIIPFDMMSCIPYFFNNTFFSKLCFTYRWLFWKLIALWSCRFSCFHSPFWKSVRILLSL